jgi:hypothetical protein
VSRWRAVGAEAAVAVVVADAGAAVDFAVQASLAEAFHAGAFHEADSPAEALLVAVLRFAAVGPSR